MAASFFVFPPTTDHISPYSSMPGPTYTGFVRATV